MAQERIAFQDDDNNSENAANHIQKKGVKFNNTRSKFEKPINHVKDFEYAADASVASDMQKKAKAAALVSKFWQIVGDKTLQANKGPTQLSIENELVRDLVQFAHEMNNDANEDEGCGSVALITLLLKTSLNLRNNYNDLSFKVEQLNQKLNNLSSATEHTSK